MWNQYTANIILDYSYRHIKANLSEIDQNKIQIDWNKHSEPQSLQPRRLIKNYLGPAVLDQGS